MMLICMVMCTLLLLAITQYSSETLEADLRSLPTARLEYDSPFGTWWRQTCESDWLRAYFCFRFGINYEFFIVL